MWFIARRQKNDKGLHGEQTLAPFIFEMASRAKIRQHGFFEDLSDEEVAPTGKNFCNEAWNLGIKQFSDHENDTSGKRLLRTYKVLDFMQKSVVDTFKFPTVNPKQFRIRPTTQDMLVFFLGAPACFKSFRNESYAASNIWGNGSLAKQKKKRRRGSPRRLTRTRSGRP